MISTSRRSLRVGQSLVAKYHVQSNNQIRYLSAASSSSSTVVSDSIWEASDLNQSSSSSSPSSPSLHHRVWRPGKREKEEDAATNTATSMTSKQHHYWEARQEDGSFGSLSDPSIIGVVQRIESQERKGGRMQQRQLGVVKEDPAEDMRLLMESYTVPALASALRDREDLLQLCAELMKRKDYETLETVLQPHEHEHILQRRTTKKLCLSQPLDDNALQILRKALMRMPRRVSQAHYKRAGVVLALCNVHGVPSLLLEKRARHLRAHPDEVCLPGGMLCKIEDRTIVDTSLREMNEEIAGLPENVQVLGVLRCNWGKVHHLVGVAVTPIVVYLGEIGHLELEPNPDEVAECFVVPLSLLKNSDKWVHREGYAPIFVGGPHVIWGLTGYICERFTKDILARYATRTTPH